MSNFCNFKDYITPEQCKQASAFLGDADELIQFLVATYNDYVSKHSEANLSVIVNPDALFRTKGEEDTFVIELTQYIRDVVGLPQKEEVKHGSNRSHPTKQTTVNQRG